jgi:hypothetical protein
MGFTGDLSDDEYNPRGYGSGAKADRNNNNRRPAAQANAAKANVGRSRPTNNQLL